MTVKIREKRAGSGLRYALVSGMVFCAAVFLFAAFNLLTQYFEYRMALTSYEALSEYGPDAFESPVDFEALKKINPQVVAWIDIPGTGISYPVAQAEDNQRYLEVTFDGKYNNSGAIFMDFDCQSDLMGQHTIIYGHNMRAGTMFAGLNRFKDEDYLKEHNVIMLYTPQRTIKLRVLGAYPARASYKQRETQFAEVEDFHQFVRDILVRCCVDYVNADDIPRMYTFATCSYEWDNTRTWVHAIEWEDNYNA